MEAEKFLVIAAHADDEVLGCGGTIARLIYAGRTVKVLILCSPTYNARGEDSISKAKGIVQVYNANEILGSEVSFADDRFLRLKDNKFDITPLLDITQQIEDELSKEAVDIILTHSHKDLNIDHQITNLAVITACRPFIMKNLSGIYTFEVPSSTECNRNEAFKPNYYVQLSRENFDKKVKALQAYKSEKRDFPHPRSEEYIEALATTRGVECSWKYAEGFELIYGVML